jgi:short-subunit dehydrogenase
MNKNAKNELMLLLGLSAATSLLFRQKKLAFGLAVATAAVGLSKEQNKKQPFNGKVALITGGSRGLGLALAKVLIKQGAYVSLLARDLSELYQAQYILTRIASKEHVMIHVCDVTNPEQLNAAIQKTAEHWRDIDLLINNAGAIIVGPFESMTMQDFEAQMKLHLYANVHATQQILPYFRKKKDGRIVNICSMGGKVAVPHMLPYDTSKFALAGFSQGITAELARENISVTTVYPTLMRTGSPIQAVFKGESEKEFAWFANADIFPGLSMSADEAAKKIIQAAADRRSELIPSWIGRMRMMVGAFLPELMLVTMGLLNQLMPRGNSQQYRTGAQSQTKKSYLFKSFEKKAEKIQKEFNQEEKLNPEYNLGLLH